MNVIIDFDSIKGYFKKEWLLNTLHLMNIDFKTTDKRQTLEDYNLEIIAG